MDVKPYDPADFPLMEEMYLRFEPYHYFEVYLTAHKMAISQDPIQTLIAMQDPNAFVSQRNFVRLSELGFHHRDCKIVQIDKDLLPLLEDTDPDFSELQMPYPAMFINHQFTIGDFKINGFLLFDISSFRKMGYEIEVPEDVKDLPHNDIRIMSVCLNTKQKFEFYSVEPLIKFDKRLETRNNYADNLAEVKDMIKGAKLVNRLGANLINTIINNPKEIETIYQNYTREQNEKRIKRGKHPHRDKLILRLTGTLKQYAQHYSVARGEISVRFLVRGHWMRFKSPRYKFARGTKKWVLPFYKGEEKAEELYHRYLELK